MQALKTQIMTSVLLNKQLEAIAGWAYGLGFVESAAARSARQSFPEEPRARITAMTMDKSLRTRKGSSSVRGVLTRAERITKLKEQERWQEGRNPIGLPKVRVQKLAMKKKKVKEDPAAADAKPAKK